MIAKMKRIIEESAILSLKLWNLERTNDFYYKYRSINPIQKEYSIFR